MYIVIAVTLDGSQFGTRIWSHAFETEEAAKQTYNFLQSRDDAFPIIICDKILICDKK